MTAIGSFDILAVLRSALEGACGVPVMTEVPEQRPERFVSVFRSGGFRTDVRYDHSRITIWAWAESEAEAYALINKARTAMDGLPTMYADVSATSESSTRVNNHTSGHRRYESIWSVVATA